MEAQYEGRNEAQGAKTMSECTPTAESSTSSINLKGTNQGFEILIESAASAEKIAGEIQTKLEEAPAFFKGGDVTLRFDDSPPRGYLGPIEEVTDRYGLRIIGVHGPEDESAEDASVADMMAELGLVEPVLASGSEANSPDLATLATETKATPPPIPGSGPPPIPGSVPAAPAPISAEAEIELPLPAADRMEAVETIRQDGALAPKMIVGPVRSGCILEFDGHLIVLGDINPGAEVSAVGSIVVLGRLRGIAHAGCTGASAFILALQLEPQQLRIGALVARAGDSETAPEKAEIAYARDGSIMVDTYKGRVPAGIATAKF
jgi:septum formation inhibitor MinC